VGLVAGSCFVVGEKEEEEAEEHELRKNLATVVVSSACQCSFFFFAPIRVPDSTPVHHLQLTRINTMGLLLTLGL